jgi:hypothetical protein
LTPKLLLDRLRLLPLLSVGHRVTLRCSTLLVFLFVSLFAAGSAFAQGGPPYYTNDPGTPGPYNWEINVGYMPFYFDGNSISHVPDLDINFGIGERIQLTYENAWLRVQHPSDMARFGLGQSNFGVKWRFYDNKEKEFSISTFPQFFLNNPNNAVRREITSPNSSFLLPLEIHKTVGWLDLNYEVGYQFVRNGPDAWIMGLVVGHEFKPRFEIDAELYNTGIFHPGDNQPTIGVGARYRIHSPIILLLMAGRSLEPAKPNQSYFVGYFGIQFLLPARSYTADN